MGELVKGYECEEMEEEANCTGLTFVCLNQQECNLREIIELVREMELYEKAEHDG